ncbi:MAG: hypothetical protein FWE83_05735 [Oscillospiraceae bacterium]|nr:hypothetical protein [Oscillospiraceae bacterium]
MELVFAIPTARVNIVFTLADAPPSMATLDGIENTKSNFHCSSECRFV